MSQVVKRLKKDCDKKGSDKEDCDNWKRLWYLKKIVIIEKDCDYWKRLWWLKRIVMIEKDCDNWKGLW